MTEFKNSKFKSKFKKECIDKIKDSEYKNQILKNIKNIETYSFKNENDFQDIEDNDTEEENLNEISEKNNNKLLTKRQLKEYNTEHFFDDRIVILKIII